MMVPPCAWIGSPWTSFHKTPFCNMLICTPFCGHFCSILNLFSYKPDMQSIIYLADDYNVILLFFQNKRMNGNFLITIPLFGEFVNGI